MNKFRKLGNFIWRELTGYVEFLFVHSPETSLFLRLRNWYWTKRANVGPGIAMHRGARLVGLDLIEVGHHLALGENSRIVAGACRGIYIGNWVGISHNSYLRSANHRFDKLDVPFTQQGHTCKEIPYNGRTYSIVIENDVWIAANSVILSGAFIRKGSIISAGSLVMGEVPAYSIVMGNPGRVIGSRLKKSEAQ